MKFDNLIYYSGIIAWLIIFSFLFVRFFLGKKWKKKLVYSIFIGQNLRDSIQRLTIEINQKNVKNQTITDVGVSIFYRLTRIGILGLLISVIPLILLKQQNNLIKSQNELFSYQNNRINKQTNLLENQNKKIDLQNQFFKEQTDLYDKQINQIDQQNNLMRDQNKLINIQNFYFDKQISLFNEQNKLNKLQTEKLEQQNILSESNRRSSLIFLMSNILDKLDEELKNNDKRVLSKELTARIISLSNAFKPYYIFKKNKLSEKILSPERGQLFLTLVLSGIEFTFLQNEILSKSNFSYADLREANLRNLNFENINLNNADLSNADLSNSYFEGTSMINCNFNEAILQKTKFKGSFLSKSSFKNADIRGAVFKTRFLNPIDLKNAIKDDKTEIKTE